MNHKEIFSTNLKMKMQEKGKSRTDICEALGFSYFTVTDWVKGKKMPRMDKVEKLANYFNCLISDLIEEGILSPLFRELESKKDNKNIRLPINRALYFHQDWLFLHLRVFHLRAFL